MPVTLETKNGSHCSCWHVHSHMRIRNNSFHTGPMLYLSSHIILYYLIDSVLCTNCILCDIWPCWFCMCNALDQDQSICFDTPVPCHENLQRQWLSTCHNLKHNPEVEQSLFQNQQPVPCRRTHYPLCMEYHQN